MDAFLAVCLLLLVPAWTLWRTYRAKDCPPEARLARYWRAIALAAGLTLILAVDWLLARRSVGLLGLSFPPPLAGWIGLLIAAVVLAALLVSMRRPRKAGNPDAERDALALLPQTTNEQRVFILFSLVVGFGWEVLFRGFLLWFLTPLVGTVGAVVIAATAYGLAHGYKSPRQLIGSLIAALLFTVGYVLTVSLWWLIVIHTALPLLGAAAARRQPSPEPVA